MDNRIIKRIDRKQEKIGKKWNKEKTRKNEENGKPVHEQRGESSAKNPSKSRTHRDGFQASQPESDHHFDGRGVSLLFKKADRKECDAVHPRQWVYRKQNLSWEMNSLHFVEEVWK